MKSRIRESGRLNVRIALKFDKRLSNSRVMAIQNKTFATSRLIEILPQDVFSDIETAQMFSSLV